MRPLYAIATPPNFWQHTAMTMPTVVEAAHKIRSGELTARDLLRQCFAAIDAHNPSLNAFVFLDRDGAQAEADEVDKAVARGETVGPLAGVPFGVKDLENCAGMPTTQGSRWYAGQGPVAFNDMHVDRLRAAGAIPIGKTAAPEFGTWAYTASPALGVTRNPWNPQRTPGGSSGGSTAAVSSGMVSFCTASDGGGSIRTPAGFTGLVGLKCTYGRIPGFNITKLSQNAVVGCVTSTVADLTLLLDIMAGPDRRDRTCLPSSGVVYSEAAGTLDVRGLRVAYTADFGFAIVDPEVARITEQAARAIAHAAGLTWVDRAITFEDWVPTYARIEGVDMFIGRDRSLWETRLDELDPLVAPGWQAAQRVTLPKLAAIYNARFQYEQLAAALFDDVDIVLSPTAAITAFEAEGPMPTTICGVTTHGGMAVPHAMLANLVNLPAINIPAGIHSNGMPVGLHLMADRYREDVCVRVATIAEASIPWPRHAPGFDN